jgi:acetyl esterase/lipase
MRNRALLTTIILAACVVAAAAVEPSSASQPVVVKLWPDGMMGVKTVAEADTTKPSDQLIAGRSVIRLGNVTAPTITVYKPAKDKDTGAAIVVFPGGGYYILAMDLEGTEVCDWLTSAGVTCVLLKYRVPNSGPYPAKSAAALQDAQRAVSLVRARAADWKIDPKRIGVLGFSAGGHLAASLSSNYEKRVYDPIDVADKISCKPDFAVIIYPGYLSQEADNALTPGLTVTANTPPTILIQAEDDPVRVENSVFYFMALKKAKVPAEIHLYPTGGHGYGLRRTTLTVTSWPDRVEDWMRGLGVLPPRNQ